MSNDRNDRQSAGPKPLSAVSVLKLLVAQGAGAKFEIQPEHIRAFETALEALAFKAAVAELAAGRTPRSEGHSRPAHADRQNTQRPAPDRSVERRPDERGPRPERAERQERDRPARSATPQAPVVASSSPSERPPRTPRPELPPRPVSGAGAIWTAEEEGKLKAGWEAGRSAQELAAESGRSAGACFARLMKLGSVQDGQEAKAGRYLVRAQKPVSLANQSEWESMAKAEGFGESAEPAAGAEVASRE